MRRLLIRFILYSLLYTASSSIYAAVVSYADYEYDDSNSFVVDKLTGTQWFRWDLTAGMNPVSAFAYANEIAGEGWYIATNQQLLALMTRFNLCSNCNDGQVDEFYSGYPTTKVQIDALFTFVSMFGNTTQYDGAPYKATPPRATYWASALVADHKISNPTSLVFGPAFAQQVKVARVIPRDNTTNTYYKFALSASLLNIPKDNVFMREAIRDDYAFQSYYYDYPYNCGRLQAEYMHSIRGQCAWDAGFALVRDPAQVTVPQTSLLMAIGLLVFGVTRRKRT